MTKRLKAAKIPLLTTRTEIGTRIYRRRDLPDWYTT